MHAPPPTVPDRLGKAKPGRIRARSGTHKGHRCQEGVRTLPGDQARRRAGLTVLLDPSSQLPGPAAARPGVKLERPQPRSGEDERA
jgi:hypothetical protein